MVDFRYHVISIVAIFVALAVGIVLGAGPLKGASDAALRDSVASFRSDNTGLRQQLSDARGQVGLTDQFAAQIAPDLVARRLPHTEVVIIRMPGVDSGVSKDVTALLGKAGASVTGTLTLTTAWTADTADSSLQRAVGKLSVPFDRPSVTGSVPTPPMSDLAVAGGQSSPTVSPDPTAAAQALALVSTALARAIVTTPAPDQYPPAARPSPEKSSGPVPGVGTARATGLVNRATLRDLADAGLVESNARLTARAAVAVILAAAPPNDGSSPKLGPLVSLVGALREASAGTVVAGPAEAARSGGLIQAVRADPGTDQHVSTVDSAERPAGAVAVVLAVLEQIQGGVGDYGAVGTTDGAMPQVLGVSAP